MRYAGSKRSSLQFAIDARPAINPMVRLDHNYCPIAGHRVVYQESRIYNRVSSAPTSSELNGKTVDNSSDLRLAHLREIRMTCEYHEFFVG